MCQAQLGVWLGPCPFHWDQAGEVRQVASKRIFEKFLNLRNRTQHWFQQGSQLWFPGAVFDEALQDPTAIDVHRHLHCMWCELLKQETSGTGWHKLHIFLQDEIGMKMLAEFQGFALQLIGKSLLEVGCGIFQGRLHDTTAPAISREPQQGSLQASRQGWNGRCPMVRCSPACLKEVTDDAGAMRVTRQEGEVREKRCHHQGCCRCISSKQLGHNLGTFLVAHHFSNSLSSGLNCSTPGAERCGGFLWGTHVNHGCFNTKIASFGWFMMIWAYSHERKHRKAHFPGLIETTNIFISICIYIYISLYSPLIFHSRSYYPIHVIILYNSITGTTSSLDSRIGSPDSFGVSMDLTHLSTDNLAPTCPDR